MLNFLQLTVLTVATAAPAAPAPVADRLVRLDDFELRDYHGRTHRLDEWGNSTVLVLAFLGNDCPLVKLYAPRLNELENEYASKGVRFIGINANQQDQVEAIRRFAETHNIRFPILKDAHGSLAERIGAKRTPEVFVLDRDRVVRYRGRIDDQYSVGVQRPQPTRRDLAVAITELLKNQPVSAPVTSAPGCLIGRVKAPAADSPITFTEHVAPILYKHCVSCHRPGAIAPFSLLTYRQAAGWAGMIHEVVADGRMPPWFANPKHGKFSNAAGLSEGEKRLLGDWLTLGMPEGDPIHLPKPPVFTDGWRIPTPNLIIPMPVDFEVPAAGVVDYQNFEVDPGFSVDQWVSAAEIRPGNRAVVHHCIVFLKPPGSSTLSPQGDLESVYLIGSAAGSAPVLLPAGMAKKIPAGWKLVFQMHYTPTGKPERDRTSLGLVLADPATVKKEVATNMVFDMEMTLPPHDRDVRIAAAKKMTHDVLLLSLAPHMHLRGKSFRYEAKYPDGRLEVLLDVPRFDFNWQDTYFLAEPKLLPRGTVIRGVAHFDNSAANLANPDPSATVKWGKQTWDEMMIGYFEIALADQDLTVPSPWYASAWRAVRERLHPLYALAVLPVLWFIGRVSRRRATARASERRAVGPPCHQLTRRG
jgi:peroxiredoxin